MTALRLDLKPRDKFAALSLAEKNEYLCDLAARFCAQTNRPTVELDKDALSRLRRFYSRRSLADLGVKELPDTDLGRALRGLGDAIKNEDRNKDIVGVLKAELPSVMRDPPLDDSQLAFFVPTIYDAPIKDDVNLMDLSPFSLSKNRRTHTIRYELKDSIVTVAGTAEYGLATVFDYDIFLHMVSYLAEEYRRYKNEESRGRRPDLPTRMYRPNAAHILKFCRRSSGGRQYKDLEAALDRLKGTQIKIVNLSGGKRREALGVSLIENYRVVSTTTTGHVDEIEIEIPKWVYDNVVRDKGHPHILTINPDYFLISQGIGRVIYRLARKAAGKGQARYSMNELHKRSGSSQALPQFRQMVGQFVASTKMFPMPDYDLELAEGQREMLLVMTNRETSSLPKAGGQLALDVA
jgi:plasmid replication initiation protein